MKKLLLTTICLVVAMCSFAQKKGKQTEQELSKEYYAMLAQKDSVGAQKVLKKIHKKYPKGWFVRRDAFMGLMRVRDNYHERVIELLKKYPIKDSEKLDGYQPFVYYNAIRSIISDYFSGVYDPQEIIDLLPDFNFRILAELYRSSCFPYHMKKAVKDEIIMPLAKPLIEEMLKKVDDMSMREAGIEVEKVSPWQHKLLDNNLGSYADILLCMGQPEEALRHINMIQEQNRYKDSRVNYTHLQVLRQLGQPYEEAFRKAYNENEVTPEMLDILKEDYIKKNGSEQGFEEYEISLRPADADARMKVEMTKKLINVEAPDFTLLTADGKKLTQADFKDKILILDFWASWCYPCKMSFPGMQMAVDRFKDDKDVVFLFVDTEEQNEGYEERALNYMKEKGFTFNVVFDTKGEGDFSNNQTMVAMHKINKSQAIPRKMIIVDGRVRYTEEGYGGSPSRLADEITALINLLK